MHNPPSASVPTARSRLVECRMVYRVVAEQPAAVLAGPLFTLSRDRLTVTGLPSASKAMSFEVSCRSNGQFGDRQAMRSVEPDLTTNVWLPSCMRTVREPPDGSESVKRTTGELVAFGLLGHARSRFSGDSQPVESWFSTSARSRGRSPLNRTSSPRVALVVTPAITACVPVVSKRK